MRAGIVHGGDRWPLRGFPLRWRSTTGLRHRVARRAAGCRSSGSMRHLAWHCWFETSIWCSGGRPRLLGGSELWLGPGAVVAALACAIVLVRLVSPRPVAGGVVSGGTLASAVAPTAVAGTAPRLWLPGAGTAGSSRVRTSGDGTHLYLATTKEINPGDGTSREGLRHVRRPGAAGDALGFSGRRQRGWVRPGDLDGVAALPADTDPTPSRYLR